MRPLLHALDVPRQAGVSGHDLEGQQHARRVMYPPLRDGVLDRFLALRFLGRLFVELGVAFENGHDDLVDSELAILGRIVVRNVAYHRENHLAESLSQQTPELACQQVFFVQVVVRVNDEEFFNNVVYYGHSDIAPGAFVLSEVVLEDVRGAADRPNPEVLYIVGQALSEKSHHVREQRQEVFLRQALQDGHQQRTSCAAVLPFERGLARKALFLQPSPHDIEEVREGVDPGRVVF
mmetsp:Transcript_18236/g.32662  ORF Transcript_18236/g.32662 Transcript_18236/m.32662 type:complete len:236 (+) Transcript_18236:7575-8282(+)